MTSRDAPSLSERHLELVVAAIDRRIGDTVESARTRRAWTAHDVVDLLLDLRLATLEAAVLADVDGYVAASAGPPGRR